MSATELMLERDTANDESAVIVAIFAASGTEVADDDLIAEFENSKATQELRAPKAGVLIHQLEVGQTVEFGVPIARIVGAGEQVDEVTPLRGAAEQDAPPVQAGPERPPAGTTQTRPRWPARFSQDARALLAQYGLAADLFDGGFVTSALVRERLPAATPPRRAAPSPATPAPLPPGAEKLDRRKLVEIDTLQQGAGSTMLSVLGMTLGHVKLRRERADIFNDRITDLVIYEAARLMKKFPKMNASFAQDTVTMHDPVHAGLAIDGGGRLVVYGIEHADRIQLLEISRIVADAVGRYMNNGLTSAEMSRVTFTVTDLSADDLDFVLPLLPRGQSCIIGITRDAKTGFRLFVGFDHRVTEGREVAAFLTELGARVLSFGTNAPAEIAVLRCDFCSKSLAEAAGRGRDKGLLSVIDRKGQSALCCASCWNGW
jgi:pyruvate/2-oxoglutarate dehydrogenase complex dihydrolipoamide acyltransferase (E2) component